MLIRLSKNYYMGRKRKKTARGRKEPLAQPPILPPELDIAEDYGEINEKIEVATVPVESKALSFSSYAAVKSDYQKAKTVYLLGNRTKALRLIKESCSRHANSADAAFLQGWLCRKVACAIIDPNAKQRHWKNAVDSAKKAVELSPNSILFAHFYASLLHDSKDYEKAVQECERALAIKNPVDPAKDDEQEESQQKISTPEGRILEMQSKLRLLLENSNIAWRNVLDSTSRSGQRGAERRMRRKKKNGSKAERKDWVRSLWNSMSLDSKKDLLRIRVGDLKAHFGLPKELACKVLLEALAFAEVNKTWKFWFCCMCTEKFADSLSHMKHVAQEHLNFRSWNPPSVSKEWTEMLLNSSWNPLDFSAVIKKTENQSEDFELDYPSVPTVDDAERTELLEKIKANFELLIRHKYLAAVHVIKVMDFTMDELQSLVSGSQLLNHGVYKNPTCICFLGVAELEEILQFLQELSYFFGLVEYTEKTDPLDDTNRATQNLEIKEKIVLNGDALCLILDEYKAIEDATQANANGSNGDGFVQGANGLLSWIYAGTSNGDQIVSWVCMKETKTQQGKDILQKLKEEFSNIQSKCEENLRCKRFQEALQTVYLFLEEDRKRGTETEVVHRSYESVLRERMDELKCENDVMLVSSRYELAAISTVLKDAEALNSNQVDFESGEDDVWRTKGYLHQMDNFIKVAIHRLKEHSSLKESKIDAQIIHHFSRIKHLELKYVHVCALDYESVMQLLVKSYWTAQLEDLAEKHAAKKSDDAAEALLAELACDSNKDVRREIDKKNKHNKNNKKLRKSKDSKALEYERGIENEAKQKHLAEQHKRTQVFAEKALVKSSCSNVEEQIRYADGVSMETDTYQAQKKMNSALGSRTEHGVPFQEINQDVSRNEDLNETGLFGTGLQNESGENNCFLNVIIQSLWHLIRFHDEFWQRSTSDHVHVGDPCVVCALYEIFGALNNASTEAGKEQVAPTSLRIALSNLNPDSEDLQQGQMNDASEVLGTIFDCLHESFTCGPSVACACIVHSLFGMKIFKRLNCQNCHLESRHSNYTSYLLIANASALRGMKVKSPESSFAELLNLVEETAEQSACDSEAGGCGMVDYIKFSLSNSPPVFTTVIGWSKEIECDDDVAAMLDILNTEIDISVLRGGGVDPQNKRNLVAVVCYRYCGRHYLSFAYNHNHEKWIMYDDTSVKEIGGWDDVLKTCKERSLQPQVLFFEAVD